MLTVLARKHADCTGALTKVAPKERGTAVDLEAQSGWARVRDDSGMWARVRDDPGLPKSPQQAAPHRVPHHRDEIKCSISAGHRVALMRTR